ncbi:tetratricopeptide (TPR) repeat protein [Flavobacterium sp. 7E]|uniref:tetratricopeptide repeat protein n=1 Tax=Flavobacterium sp. 7E TaxID=2735898 RepID=UPI001570C26C|nr:tetratricopeptide repeat protein [Flavobacterium sp. 7E]NRS89786.1 tetratricopeptide (TPR) repeat protein [Flavobacterium sp. 7E]
MKGKYVILASALMVSVATFAQKDQIKAAEKAFRKGQAQEAVGILNEAESLIANASDSEKAQYFFIKGNALLDLANKNVEEDKNLSLAADAYVSLIAAEKASGKSKYSGEAANSIITIKNKLINSAIELTKNAQTEEVNCLASTDKILADYKLSLKANTTSELEVLLAKKRADMVDCEKNTKTTNSKAAKKLYDAYLLDKKDTLNLYYAAATYVNAQDYDNALKLYGDLKDLNYSGKATNYLAINKLNQQNDNFSTLQERDRMVKLGTHEQPTIEEIPSKRGEIYKNIALILVQNGKTAEAKEAITAARKTNPDDTSLILTEANLYLETKDFDTYKKLIGQVLEKNPNDADLIFNLGVISSNAKNVADAEKYYNRAIEINPKYLNAYINMAALKLDKEGVIIEEMNKLGTSDKDMQRYDVLKKQRQELFKTAIPYLTKALELDPKNGDVSKTLLGVYSALEMTAEKKALEAKM